MPGSGITTLTRAYNARQVLFTVNGVPAINVADGDFCEVEYAEDQVKDFAGADGEVAISVTNDFRGTFTLRLMNTSEYNDYLSGLWLAFLTSKTLMSIGIKDLNGRSVYTGALSWFTKPAPSKFARDPNERVWAMKTGQLKQFVGGNTIFPGPVL
jgi:structural protein KPP10_ORF10